MALKEENSFRCSSGFRKTYSIMDVVVKKKNRVWRPFICCTTCMFDVGWVIIIKRSEFMTKYKAMMFTSTTLHFPSRDN